MTMGAKKGTTLVEVLFSAAIIGLVIGSILLIFAQTVDMSKKVDYEYAATVIARSQLEWAKAFIEINGFDALTQDGFGGVGRLDWHGEPAETGDFMRTTTVEEAFDGNSALTRVNVEVSYTYRGKETENPITLTTVFIDTTEEE